MTDEGMCLFLINKLSGGKKPVGSVVAHYHSILESIVSRGVDLDPSAALARQGISRFQTGPLYY
jgi:hypothetical protein